MADIKAHLEANLAQAEALGQAERAKKLKARLDELEKPVEEPAKPLDKLNKAELLEAAEAAGVEADESMTKKQIVEALEGES
jgi:hypothetical protein